MQLSDLTSLVGVDRDQATPSQVPLTLGGVVGTTIPDGSLAEGGGEGDTARWVISSTVVIGAGGTVDVVAVAEEAGATIALAGAIDRRVTIISGWDTVTNAVDATVGMDREDDAELKQKRALSLQILGARSRGSISANLLALDFIEAAAVAENDDSATQTVEGIVMEPNSMAVVVHPSPLTDDQKTTVILVIFNLGPFGIKTLGDEEALVTALDGGQKTVRFRFATLQTVNVASTVTLEAGFVLADVDQALKDAIVTLFDDFIVGADVLRLDITALAADIDGIRSVDVLLDTLDADVSIPITAIALLGTNTVTL